jgi:hypothetical protein
MILPFGESSCYPGAGGGVSPLNFLLQEDGVGEFVLEDGFGLIQLES